MPDLPRILARPDLPTVSLPRVSAQAAGAPWAELSQAAGKWEVALRERQTPVDAALEVSKYNIKAEDWKNEAQVTEQQQPDGTTTYVPADPSTWVQNWQTKQAAGLKEQISTITDPRVKAFLQIAANKSLDEHVKDLNNKALTASQAKIVNDVTVAGKSLARQAADAQSDELRKQSVDLFEGLVKTAESPTRIGNKIFGPAWVKGEGAKAREAFTQEYYSHKADGEIERDPPQFLQELKAGAYNALDSDKRRQLESHANAAITSGNSSYKRTQAEKEEAAGREIQMMVDKRVSTDLIQQKLQEFTVNKVMDSKTRNYWDDRLMRGEKADDPVQTANFERIKADFTAQRPTSARVQQFRDMKTSMRNKGELGDKGAAQIGNMINIAEAQLEAQGRAQRGEQRAIEAAGRAGGGGKMTAAQAFQAVQKANFPNEVAGHPTSKAHKEDVQEVNDRVVLIPEGDTRAVVNEIVERRRKTKELEARLKAAKVEAAAKNPAMSHLLDDAKAAPKK